MFRSLIRISEVNLENTLGGKPHSFVVLKHQPSQTTLISRRHCENTETSFVFSLAYSYLCTRMD